MSLLDAILPRQAPIPRRVRIIGLLGDKATLAKIRRDRMNERRRRHYPEIRDRTLAKRREAYPRIRPRAKEYQREYRKDPEHKAQQKQRNKEWRDRNRERYNRYNREYYARNPDRKAYMYRKLCEARARAARKANERNPSAPVS